MELIYNVSLTPDAARGLRKLPARLVPEIAELLGDLAFDPLPSDALELRGHAGYYRIRINGYRVIYRVSDSRRRVRVLRIESRDRAYVGFESP